MGSLSLDINLLRTIIGSIVAAAYIWWWIWVTYSTLAQLRGNQLTFLGLLGGCARSLMVTLIVLAFIAFL